MEKEVAEGLDGMGWEIRSSSKVTECVMLGGLGGGGRDVCATATVDTGIVTATNNCIDITAAGCSW